mgnify:FL=1|jgi:hypothetical protein
MSKMAEIALEIDDMLYAGSAPDTIAETLGVPLDWVLAQYDVILNELELSKQHEFMSYGEQ